MGYEEGGYLTEAVRRRPYSVILFDEIEKAHPDVFNVLLQLLDDGRLTDSQGHVVDFKNTIVIMTSNLGTKLLSERGALTGDELGAKMMSILKEFFRPEFINRVDEIIIFHFLTREDIGRIVDIQVGQISDRLRERNIELRLTDRAREALADRGYVPEFGARPLRRLLQRRLLDPLAKLLIEGTIVEGNPVVADWEDDGIVFGRE